MIKPLKKEHAAQVAGLHIEGIPTGFISSLGIKFVTALYESIAVSPDGFGCVEENDRGFVLGFVSFTTDLGKLYKTVLKKNVLRFSFLLIRKVFSLKTIKRLFETLLYPARVKTPELPKAELLSIVVIDSERGKGLAKALIQSGFRECHKRGVSKVKVLVADFNKPANKLYQKTGFTQATQIENHGIVSNVYVVNTNFFVENE